MRGRDHRNDTLFSYVRPDSRIPENHPLRAIRVITDTALKSLSGRFDALYSVIGRPSIPPEKLLRAHAEAIALLYADKKASVDIYRKYDPAPTMAEIERV